jgi:hypothetical protein
MDMVSLLQSLSSPFPEIPSLNKVKNGFVRVLGSGKPYLPITYAASLANYFLFYKSISLFLIKIVPKPAPKFSLCQLRSDTSTVKTKLTV